jgi:uncharacterized protein (DUF4415 family)
VLRPLKKRAKSSLRGVSEYGTDWDYLANITDEEAHRNALSDPDAQPTTPEFWKNARVVYPKGKHPITLRLDSDILTWFRLKKGYQTEINAILRTYMQAHRGKRGAGSRRRARRRFAAAAE